jgi:hypothetical protein
MNTMPIVFVTRFEGNISQPKSRTKLKGAQRLGERTALPIACMWFRVKGCVKFGGFHGGDCEQCRLLGYIQPVLTSQETHYVSAIEPSRLMLCKI